MTIKIKRVTIYRIVWTVFSFIMIFAPPIVPYIHLILAIFSALLVLVKFRSTGKAVLVESGIYRWAWSIVIWLLYSFSIPLLVSALIGDIINISNYTQTINRYGVLVFCTVFSGTAFLSFIREKNLPFFFFVECIIDAGIIEAICSILAFFSPKIKNAFIFIMNRSGTGLYNNNWYITVRAFGLANTLVDLFGLGIAIIAGICFIYGIMYKRRYILFSPFIAVSTLLNSRTGVLLYVLIVIVSSIYFFAQKRARYIIVATVALIVLVTVTYVAMYYLATKSDTFKWVKSGLNSIVYFLKKWSVEDRTNSLGLVFYKNSWILPDPIRTIIGTGHSLYRAEGYPHSDVGYINEIWISGIIGCAWLYSTQIKLAMRSIRGNVELFRICSLAILICYFVFNIKGAALGFSPGGNVMILCLMGFSCFTSHEQS